MWVSRGGVAPLAVPLCGFNGKGCPLPAWQLYQGYIISGIVLFCLIVAAVASLIYYIIRTRLREI